MEEKKTQQLNKECGGDLMVYLHIPFCVKKCAYCDFLSGPCTPEAQEEYLQALLREIEAHRAELKGKHITSIFFGGGTPSLVSPEWIGRILQKLEEYGDFAKDIEITMECNPGTANQEKLLGYRRAGVNRLSIGLQSAKDEELQLLGRIHNRKQFYEVYEGAAAAGFENINVDLISALPGQTPDTFGETLKEVLNLRPAPTHISVYSLILEEGTPFYERYQAGEFTGKLALPTEEQDREIYAVTGKMLAQAGYEQVEISNYAKPGYDCRHNCGYWLRRDYLGFGLGAASLYEEKRFTNTSDMSDYKNHSEDCREDLQVLTRREQMEETMFLGLRMNKGVEKERFRYLFGVSMEEVYGTVIEKNCRDGLLVQDEKTVALTDKGRDLSNYVMAQFLMDV